MLGGRPLLPNHQRRFPYLALHIAGLRAAGFGRYVLEPPDFPI